MFPDVRLDGVEMGPSSVVCLEEGRTPTVIEKKDFDKRHVYRTFSVRSFLTVSETSFLYVFVLLIVSLKGGFYNLKNKTILYVL